MLYDSGSLTRLSLNFHHHYRVSLPKAKPMKITGQKYETMAAAVKAVVMYAGGPAKVRAAYVTLTEKRMIWDLWHAASRNLLYDDAHPSFALGMCTRVFPHDPTFDPWSDGVNDAHLETALFKIWRELSAAAVALEAELREAWEGQGDSSRITFEDWVKEMADNPRGTLQSAAAQFLKTP